MLFIVTKLESFENSEVDRITCESLEESATSGIILDVLATVIELSKGDKIYLQFTDSLDKIRKDDWDYIVKGNVWKQFQKKNIFHVSYGGMQMIANFSFQKDALLSSTILPFFSMDAIVYMLLRKWNDVHIP